MYMCTRVHICLYFHFLFKHVLCNAIFILWSPPIEKVESTARSALLRGTPGHIMRLLGLISHRVHKIAPVLVLIMSFKFSLKGQVNIGFNTC
jgi:hypothetical protein